MIDYDDRWDRMFLTSGACLPLSEEEVIEDGNLTEELQFQMLDYAYKHANYSLYMDVCFEQIITWYWNTKELKIDSSFIEFRKLSNVNCSIFWNIENYVFKCIIDKHLPVQKRVISILRSHHRKEKVPF